jgi:DNA-binding beta-propeller fold protein YncE
VDVIDTTTRQKVKNVPTKGTIHNVYVTPDGKYAVAGSIVGKTINVIDAKTNEPAFTIDMDLGVRPMTFNTNRTARRSGSSCSSLDSTASRLWTSRQEGDPSHPESGSAAGKATVPQGSDPSHGMAVTSDGKTLVVCSRLNNYLYSYSLPDLKPLGGAELSGKGAGWVTLTPTARRPTLPTR